MASLKKEEIVERIKEGAKLIIYTNDEGKTEYSITNTRSQYVCADDIRIGKKSGIRSIRRVKAQS